MAAKRTSNSKAKVRKDTAVEKVATTVQSAILANIAALTKVA